MNLIEKLQAIQSELKAPKGQYNSFGKYKYRSCEDILEAVKPLLAKHKCVLTVSDMLEYMGDRYYIRATATIWDTESSVILTNTAYAREEETKKGMDGSQITGTASSYSRKYALNGLLLIDDTKDADTDEHRNQTKPDLKKSTDDIPDERTDAILAEAEATMNDAVTSEQLDMLVAVTKDMPPSTLSRLAKAYEVADLADLTRGQWAEAMEKIRKAKEKK